MEVVSKEKIKPSSPTSQHLQKINLSMLDQLAPPTYVTLLFFYESPKRSSSADSSQISRNLKQSLSDVLTSFPPLAGRINQENSCIDCNDDGVVYVEKRARARMSHVVQLDNPDLTELLKYVPSSDVGADKLDEIPLCIQVNFFDCGGVAISARISHKIADMKSFVFFMNAWAATCRNNDDHHHRQGPIFDLATHFPPLDLPKFFSEQKAAPPPETVTDVNMVTKRFVFDKNMLFALKKLGASSQVTNPSKIEALTAFVWKNFIVSSKIDDKCMRSKKKKFVAMSAVNVRARAIPSLPEEIFGNACALAVTWSKNDEENMLKEEEYRVLISKLRNAIKKIDSDYVGGMKNGKDEKFDHLSQEEAKDQEGCSSNSSLEVCIFSSWCRFPMYEVNYGWGKPFWVSTCPEPHKNFIVFIDTKCGDGIEAWVTMAEADLAVLDKNYSHLRSLMMVIP